MFRRLKLWWRRLKFLKQLGNRFGYSAVDKKAAQEIFAGMPVVYMDMDSAYVKPFGTMINDHAIGFGEEKKYPRTITIEDDKGA